jgi:hypothetical protein
MVPTRFTTYKSLLLEFKSDTPTFYKLMKMDMKDALKCGFIYFCLHQLISKFFPFRKLSVDASSMLKKTGTIMRIDKQAMEEAAKRVLAARETALSGSEMD